MPGRARGDVVSDPYSQDGSSVRFEWGEHGLGRLAPVTDVVVIVDVLTFTTAVDVAVGRGASVFPYPWAKGGEPDYARARGAELAVARSDVDETSPYSLSPRTLASLPSGARIVVPSPNGSTLAFAAREAGVRTVVAGCLRNAAAVAAGALDVGETISVIAAGERWGSAHGPLRPSIEDLLGAGAVIAGLDARELSPEASVARSVFEGSRAELEQLLRNCASGRELSDKGYADDVTFAADLNGSQTFPMLDDDAFVNVA